VAEPVADLRPAGLPLVGRPAPAVRLPDQHGATVDLADLRGQRAALVVFFPFAFSGICTGELCALRDDLSAFAQDGVQVVAVSCDPVFALRAWGEREGYDFPLLSDFWPHGRVARDYGVFSEDLGRPERGTFLLDAGGVLRWSVVSHPGRPRDLLAYREAVGRLRE
jgi:mycoredoxin-dependent peroxiredoxin